MNGIINNMQTAGAEYSEYLKGLRKEGVPQDAKLQKTAEGEKRSIDRVEVNANKASAATLDIFDKSYTNGIVSMLLSKIMQEPSLALEAQGGLQASKVAALLES